MYIVNEGSFCLVPSWDSDTSPFLEIQTLTTRSMCGRLMSERLEALKYFLKVGCFSFVVGGLIELGMIKSGFCEYEFRLHMKNLPFVR